MKKKVLVFPAGTEIGLELHNALKYSTIFEVWGGTSSRDHSYYVYKNLIEGLPFVTDADFIEEMNRVCTQNEISFIYPAHDSVNLMLAQHTDRLCAAVITSPLPTVDICRDKAKTYAFFSGADFIPRTFANPHEVTSYPVFIKPTVGQGSVGAKKITSAVQLKEALQESTEPMVICEYLSGMEYTIDCFTDKYGVLQCAKMRDRARIKTGISVNSHIVPLPIQVQQIANTINQKLTFKGAWFFQVKKNNEGAYKLLEISPRIPGTMGVSRNLNINFAQLSLYTAMDYDVSINANDYDITVDRAFINRYDTKIKYDHVYVDLDDTLILNKDTVNSYLMMFLYQCVNQEKTVTLLTKHAKDVENTLAAHKIGICLFDEILHIAPGENKAHYIKHHKNAIFIDDSFSERRSVAEELGLPVFDLDSIECLIDWRM
ncbi:MAG: ATP-grasp domain-containing protein [Oscillospiraceae bacterium]|nr:ATP-grasp domain-containing protein [Oscillospiraceae bacterium]